MWIRGLSCSSSNYHDTDNDNFFLSAGIDTTRLTLRFALLHMATYPEIQARVQEEIDRVVGKYNQLSISQILSYLKLLISQNIFLSPVVQSIVSLTSSLRGQLVKCFMTL